MPEPAGGCTVQDASDQSNIRVSLGGGAWGEAVELATPSTQAHYTLVPEAAEALGHALLDLAPKARANRERQRAHFQEAMKKYRDSPA